MGKWNGNKFSVYKSEEKSALGLIKELGEQTNYNTDELEQVKISNNKKVSHDEMKEIYKIDNSANFTGSWHGISKPTASQEGLQATVDKIVEEDIPSINELLDNNTNDLNLTKSELDILKESKITKGTMTRYDLDNSKDENKFDLNDLNEKSRKAILNNNSIDLNYVLGENSVTENNLSDRSVTSSKRTVLGEYAHLVTTEPVNINTLNKTLEFGSGYIAINNRNKNYTLELENTSISVDSGQNGVFIIFNILTKSIETTFSATQITENHLLIGTILWSTKSVVINANYTVDGITLIADKSVTFNKKCRLGDSAKLLSTQKIILDGVSKKLIFPSSGVIILTCGNYAKIISTTYLNYEWDLSTRNANYIGYDFSTNELISLASQGSFKDDQVCLGYINFGGNFAHDLNMNYDVLGEESKFIKYMKFRQKIASFIGDSITNGDNGQGASSNTWSWTSYLSKLNGFSTVNNFGKNGSRITKTSSKTDSFVERCGQITNSDLIGIWGGINDFNNSMPLGNINSEDETTFYGALKKVIQTLVANNPKSKLFVITPMKSSKVNSQTPNKIGLTLLDYVNAIIEVCDLYSIPVLDMYRKCNISPFLQEHIELFMKDGLHPTELGYERIAYTIASFIESL